MSNENNTSRAQPTPGSLTVIPNLSGAHVRSDVAGGLDVAWFGCNSTYGNDGNHSISPAEAEANARLFVVARDLVGVVEEMLEEMQVWESELGEHPAATKARAIIDKLEGKS